jgi:hypothetical protein
MKRLAVIALNVFVAGSWQLGCESSPIEELTVRDSRTATP